MKQLRTLTALLFLFACCSLRADFTGVYDSTGEEKLTLTLAQTGDKLEGTVKASEIEMKVKGDVRSDTAKGTLTLDIANLTLYFEFKLSGKELTAKVAETADLKDAETEKFVRRSEETKTENPKKGIASKFSKEGADVLVHGEEYTHPGGGKFKHPKTWKVENHTDYVQLIPPDVAEGEVILMAAEDAQGATDPASPEIIAYLDSQIAESIPDAKHDGKPERAVAGAGKGVIVSWMGHSDGRELYVRAYATIIQGKGVALIAIGTKGQIQARDKVLRQIMQTIGWGQGKLDNQLVGTWSYWGYTGSSDGKYGREERIQVQMNADGTFSYKNDSETSISAQGTNQQGDVTWVGGMAGRRGSGWDGSWTADGSTIILNFADGTSESFRYRFEQQGSNTFLVTEPADGSKGKMEWSRG